MNDILLLFILCKFEHFKNTELVKGITNSFQETEAFDSSAVYYLISNLKMDKGERIYLFDTDDLQ